MQTKLEKAAETLLDIAVEEVFYQLHQKFFTKSGDIFPEQQFRLDELKEEIVKIMVAQVSQNL